MPVMLLMMDLGRWMVEDSTFTDVGEILEC